MEYFIENQNLRPEIILMSSCSDKDIAEKLTKKNSYNG
jgi:hypothetical protein